jgi:metal-dependent HD superfamily phosphatase/phosphodiesterase
MKTTEIKEPLKIHVPLNDNKLLEKTIEEINKNEEIYALWKVMNVNATQRLGYSDHGPVHFQIVSNVALRLSRILVKHGVEMTAVRDFALTNDYAEVIIFLASIMHDLGMSINRDGHEEFSLFLANNLLHEILTFLPVEERTIVISETLHAIISHRADGKPMTIEAGIVRVADALDMSEGRSRIPYLAGQMGIHAISAAAIDNVEIKEGEDTPIKIVITMNNSAGIFQVDELLKEKLAGSKIESYVEVTAIVPKESEKHLVTELHMLPSKK